jgi:hypothetical protein
VSVALQRTSRKCDNDDGTLEKPLVAQPVTFNQLILGLAVLTKPGVGCLAATTTKDANAVHALQPSNLLCCFQAVHDGELNVHKHQMETTCFPFCHCFFSVHRPLPPHLQALHEGSQDSQVDNVVFHNQHVDGGY